MTVVLDTSFLVDLWAGKHGALELHQKLKTERTPLLVPPIVLMEFLSGRTDPVADYLKLQRASQLLHFTPEDARAGASIARKLRRKGVFPGWNDLMIAGQAERHGGLPIVTANPKHFPESKTITY